MVSGFVTSPDDQSRICFDDASPIRIASKSLISIKSFPSLANAVYRGRVRRSVVELEVDEVGLTERPGLLLDLLFDLLVRRQLDVVEVAECLVGRKRQLAVLVDPLLALLELLGGRLARGGAERAGREVDAELLRGPQELVVLLAHLDLAALVGEDVDVE